MVYRFLVSGRVQGVYYRKFTSQRLQRLGVFGYIRNLPDGKVEVVVDPRGVDLDSILSALKEGSPMSRVDNIEYEVIDTNEQFSGFEIRY